MAEIGIINIGHDQPETGFYPRKLHLVMDAGGQKFEPNASTESLNRPKSAADLFPPNRQDVDATFRQKPSRQIPRAQAKAGREKLSDEALLDLVQRQTFLSFWDGAQPVSGLARDRAGRLADPDDHDVATGGSGFGVMA